MLESGAKLATASSFIRRFGSSERKNKRNDEKLMLRIPRLEEVAVDGVDSSHKSATNILFRPTVKNHEAIDCWVPKIGMFQMTVYNEHKMGKAVHRFAEEFSPNLFWAVPSTIFETFAKRDPAGSQDILQYAIKIPTAYDKYLSGAESEIPFDFDDWDGDISSNQVEGSGP